MRLGGGSGQLGRASLGGESGGAQTDEIALALVEVSQERKASVIWRIEEVSGKPF